MSNNFELIIIGGGINGAGIARDATMRGLKVLLLDKNDFAYGTSSRSTKLIHGGIRYLENFDFKLVWEACHERKILTQIAPQLVQAMPFIIPVYQGDKRPLWFMRLGMMLYDWMAGLKNLHPHHHLSARELLALAPTLQSKKLRGGGVYYDAQTNDARLVLANIKAAAAHGAVVKNYTEVNKITVLEGAKNANLFQIEAVDVLTGKTMIFTAPYVVNATGPWLDRNLERWQIGKIFPHTPKTHLRLSKGIHFFIPKLLDHYAILVPATDGRVFFVIPWGKYSLIGTTDTDYQGEPDAVKSTEDEKKYLLAELQRLFPDHHFILEDIKAEYAGLRPLYTPPAAGRKLQTGQVSREYRLEEQTIHPHAATIHGENTHGEKAHTVAAGSATLLSILGGKITTYRHLAQIVTDRVMRQLKGATGHCPTAYERLPGSQFPESTWEEFRQKQLSTSKLQRFEAEVAEHLLATYGSEIDVFLTFLEKLKKNKTLISSKLSESGKERLEGGLAERFEKRLEERIIPGAPVIWAELFYAIQHEFVRTAEDFIRRRTDLYLYFPQYPDLAERIAKAF